jgi:hypothetical protein
VSADIVEAAVTYLFGQPEVLDALGADPGTGAPYLYPNSLYTVMQNTQSAAAVVARAGGFAAPNAHNTARFPRIALELTVDPLRDEMNNVLNFDEAGYRADTIYKIIDPYLHRPRGGSQWWGSVRTVSCVRLSEPLVYAVPDGSGLIRHITYYGVQQA